MLLKLVHYPTDPAGGIHKSDVCIHKLTQLLIVLRATNASGNVLTGSTSKKMKTNIAAKTRYFVLRKHSSRMFVRLQGQ